MSALDLPWAPLAGQTALRVVASNAERTLCEDKSRPEIRTLWTAEGRLLAVSGAHLTLAGVAAPVEARAAETRPLDEVELATLKALDRSEALNCLALAEAIARGPDKALIALLALRQRGLVADQSPGEAKPRAWSLTAQGAEALGAATPATAKIAPAPVIASAAKPSRPPAQMSLF